MMLDDIRKVVQEELIKNEKKNAFGVSLIPAHSHNGTDSLPVDPNNLRNSNLYFAVKQTLVPSTQILTLKDTPVTLVPAFGSNTTSTNINSVIIVEGITAKVNFGTTAYTGANALEFRYTDGTGAKVTADMAAAFINSVANAYNHVAGIVTAFTPVVNSPIVVCVPTANPGGGGDSSITFTVKYRVITL